MQKTMPLPTHRPIAYMSLWSDFMNEIQSYTNGVEDEHYHASLPIVRVSILGINKPISKTMPNITRCTVAIVAAAINPIEDEYISIFMPLFRFQGRDSTPLDPEDEVRRTRAWSVAEMIVKELQFEFEVFLKLPLRNGSYPAVPGQEEPVPANTPDCDLGTYTQILKFIHTGSWGNKDEPGNTGDE